MDILIAVGIFVATVLLIEGAYFSYRRIYNPERKKVRARLKGLSREGYDGESIDIIRKKVASDVPWLNRIFLRFLWTQKLNRLVEQANTQHTLGFYVLLSAVLAFGGFWVGLLITRNYLIIAPLAAFLGVIPFLFLYTKKKHRMLKFQRQLPDAMDLIARSLKAGHAFAGGLKMVADEFDDPIGQEFDIVVNEINFGVSVSDALKSLSKRVDSPDLNFFVISVILQRETGGNLAEILENIAHLIRERFKLHGYIRVLSAEGKLSAIVLIALPFFVVFMLSYINPDYIRTLLIDPIGNIMVVFAVLLMIAGIFVMKRMIQIKV